MHLDQLDESRLRLRRGQKWSLYPADVLPAWVADMDFEVAEPIRAALAERVANHDLGYPLAPARTDLPALFAARVAARFDWSIDPAEVVVLSDVVQGLYVGLETLSAPGDGVLILTPIYPPFLHAAAETGRRVVRCPLVAGASRYEIDFDALQAAVDGGTRVLMLCHPHNPSGRAFSRDELEALAALACRHDLVLISDEIHAELMLNGERHIPIASLSPEIAARTVTLMSASKAFNIAGLCMAFAHFGSRALRERFARVPPHTRGGTNTLAIAAVQAAWTAGQPWLDEVIAYLRANRDHVAAHCRRHWPRVRHFSPEATYLAWLDMRGVGLPGNAQEYFLQHGRVALSDGRAFGEEGEGFVRLNFATSRPLLDAVLARMDAALAAHAAAP
jgi:cystathionine beta-lyase